MAVFWRSCLRMGKGIRECGLWAKLSMQSRSTRMNLTIKKELSSLRVGGDALKQGEGIAHTIGNVGSKVGRG